MSIENEIAGLTQSTTDLLEAVNTKKSTLDTAVSNAQTAVTDATSQVSLAAAEKVGAQTARDTAESFKDQAYTYSQSAASAVAYQDLTAIAETKAESAVDVFVYDTSKDSDGGAWRQRTQGTSWYNETLNTATRGSRKEFPAVAVIVAESQKVTIYDGDDPSMPMWMVFSWGVRNFIGSYIGSTRVTSLSIKNGLLCIGQSGDGVSSIDFLKETALKVASPYVVHWNRTIDGRNDNSRTNTNIYAKTIVNRYVNDVAMTVLPDAPIDPATGLPIPTIAVATDGGVSVIKDDGSVVDSSYTGATSDIEIINDTIFTKVAGSATQIYTYKIDGITSDVFTFDRIYRREDGTAGLYPQIAFSSLNNFFAGSDTNDVAVGYLGGGLWKLNQGETVNNNSAYPDDAVAKITSEYNTGWMNGDIKLATLSDTDDTDLVGSELVTNGTFDTDTSGWATKGVTTTISVENGRLKSVRDNIGTWGAPYYAFASTVGKTYQVTITIETNANNSNTVNLRASSANTPTSPSIHNTSMFNYVVTAGQTITTTQYFTATDVYSFVHVMGNAGDTWYIDNVSITEAEPDRSVNNNGLQVFGTVTREPVATGADLVAYKDFSIGHLKQPYNPDLDFGTGDFCYTGWVKDHQYFDVLFARSDGVTANDLILQTSNVRTRLRLFIGGVSYDGLNVFPDTDEWWHFTFTRKDGVLSIYVNGKVTYSISSNHNVSQDNATLQIGVASDVFASIGTDPLRGSLALLRISGTAPTAEQIAKIYRDEKVLFQEGAQATLYGTSDAVTALAYDDGTNILSVGTSSGRSDFQGLRRVSNTTDAVGTAISASNGLIVEE